MGTRHSLHLFYACIWNHVLLSTYSLYTMEICCISMQKIIISYCDMLHLSMVYALLYCIQHSFIVDLINNIVIAAHFSEDEYGDQYSCPNEYFIQFYLMLGTSNYLNMICYISCYVQNINNWQLRISKTMFYDIENK